MNQQEAIRQVAEHMAGILAGMTFDEALGMTVEQTYALSEADTKRYANAIEIVGERLHRMAQPRGRKLLECGCPSEEVADCGHQEGCVRYEAVPDEPDESWRGVSASSRLGSLAASWRLTRGGR